LGNQQTEIHTEVALSPTELSSPQPSTITPEPITPEPSPTSEPWYEPVARLLGRSESWLQLTGVVLLLFALGFLFQYAVAQGWLTPAVRVGIGLVLGTLLLAGGTRLDHHPGRQAMLFGGGVASYYISGFAAYMLYALWPLPLAFGLMVANTVLALVLAVRYDRLILVLLGVIGGIATPLVLGDGEGSMPGLMGYTLLLLLGSGLIYWRQGWSLAWWVTVWGSMGLVGLGVDSVGMGEESTAVSLIVLFAVTILVLAGWLLPIVRPSSVRPVRVGWGWLDQHTAVAQLLRLDRYLFAFSMTLFWYAAAGAIVRDTWGFTQYGWLALAITAVVLLVANRLENQQSKQPVLTLYHVALALLFATLAWNELITNDNWQLLVLVGQLLALQFWAQRGLPANPYRFVVADLAAVFPAILLLDRLSLTLTVPQTAEMLLTGLVNLLVIATAVFIAWFRRGSKISLVYALLAHVGLLVWFWQELSPYENGQAWVSVAWGVYTAVLLIAGLYRHQPAWRLTALATLALLVGKLFLVDLEFIAPLTRVILFFVVGGLFLGLSYLVTRQTAAEEAAKNAV
jgi:uncharacterized membrane protein